jgi:indole-3-acetate monooxygenase
MTVTTPTPPMDAEGILTAARALAPHVASAADRIETGRCLPRDVVSAMQRAGIFRMAMPRAWGGPELDLLAQLRAIEAVARLDGSVGWCAMIGCDGGYVSAYLDQAVARALWADLDAPTAFVAHPRGRAVPVAGGYRVSGRWPFASGCQHSTWLASGCLVLEDGAPRLAPTGQPEVRICVLPAEACAIIDTWQTTGVRGSGSHDYTVRDRFVPEEHTFPLGAPSRRPGPLYLWPMTFVLKLSGVALGIAQHALDTLVAAAEGTATSRGTSLRDEVYAQVAIAEAEALVGSARSYVVETVAALWEAVEAGSPPARPVRTRARLAMTHAFRTCVAAVDRCYEAGGSASLYVPSPLDRCLRDIHTINQHVLVSAKTYEVAGRQFFGLDPLDPTF